MSDDWKFTASDFEGFAWPYERECAASIANAKLAERIAAAPVVRGMPSAVGGSMHWSEDYGTVATHTARLIQITPIVLDTAESLLRKMADAYATSLGPSVRSNLVDRARRLLEEK